MADTISFEGGQRPFKPMSLDEARAMARERFKERLQQGERIGECACHEDEPDIASDGSPSAHVAGVRFRDSGRTFYFSAGDHQLEVGDWVLVATSRGREAGRVVIAPHQIRLNLLTDEPREIERPLRGDEIERMDDLRRQSASAVKIFGVKIRERQLPMKAISAEYNFDGSVLSLNYSYAASERPNLRDLIPDLARTFQTRVELNAVGPRDEARLLGGLGRCGRTLCCSSWLPVYPEISMGMAKTQDLGLNPSKVSGVCGRLLCCLSYENEQYKQMKAVLPRLGQQIDTPAGRGMVVSLQVIKEQVTVRLLEDPSEMVFSSAELGLATPEVVPASILTPRSGDRQPANVKTADSSSEDGAGGGEGGRRRRRRRRGRGGSAGGGSNTR
jgi:cell fate regulator YaaT (PSP1 superfamily)